MTERIDLDELDVGDDDEPEEESNPGDWFWRGEGDPENEPPRTTGPAVKPDDEDGDGADAADTADATGADGNAVDQNSQPAPHVPTAESGKPVGIPAASGGAGAGAGAGSSADDGGEPGAAEPTEPRPAGSAAEGPHGGGVDDMTIAFTYRALQQLEHPAAVFADAYGWSDWIGIVGDVGTPAITKFQRDHGLDADFFTGSGTDPSERLSEIDRTSMFYAERMVVIGTGERGEAIAEAADWEYIPLETAAEKAGWELS
ncbi:DUF7124 domain-containing protein [Halopiger xanaduensis]|uniref:DUF7124 domain-containing protein n=1 Tax=Halopiger xanaduensis (strain DSM 18323 / JCM 14033 / SH-6) TaxID=797210 RepID=F8DC91_HALXS|nr:hypothetical protein [Halopiger xanaduensis]AEH38348.1 hypothetical protein Halxa_3742 [Halopiger xanaduensis SH-6]